MNLQQLKYIVALNCFRNFARAAEAHINLYQRGLHPWAYAEYPCRYPQNVYSGRDDGRRHQEIRHQAVGLGAKKPRCVSHQGFKMILFVMKYNHSGWLRHKSMATFVLWGMMDHSLIFFKHIVELAYLSRDLHQYFLLVCLYLSESSIVLLLLIP